MMRREKAKMRLGKEKGMEAEKKMVKERVKRKDEQKENRIEMDEALVQQHDIVRDEEGPLMKDEMMNERREWFTQQLAQGGDFPEDLTGFYKMKNPPPPGEEFMNCLTS